jgi:stage II sporulation protein D
MTRLIALAAVVLLALPAAAAARTRSSFTIRGAGFGHGVGMSQYGTLGYAEHGWTAPAILAHYYRGTQLGTTDPNRIVRVLLATGPSATVTGASQAGARKLSPAATYLVARGGAGQVVLRRGSRKVATFSAPLEIAGAGGTVQLAGHGTYRGALEIVPGTFSGLTVINEVALEDYVQGVVPAESPASWPLEALKAQAIAARTYAITTSQGGAFDQYADTRSQVYGGVGVETAASNEAVAETRGQVVTYQGQPVVTYFFSTSGGRTENVENSFSGASPEPWLKSVRDPYDGVSPRHRWTFVWSAATAAGKLSGLYSGRFKGIRILQRGVSPRIVSARVTGTRGSLVVDGATLRGRLGLYDTWASFWTITARAVGSGGAVARRADRVLALSARATRRAALAGTVFPGRRGTRIVLQERVSGHWVRVRRTRARAGGAYRVAVPHPGVFRIVSGGGIGPSVRF